MLFIVLEVALQTSEAYAPRAAVYYNYNPYLNYRVVLGAELIDVVFSHCYRNNHHDLGTETKDPTYKKPTLSFDF